MLGSGVDAQTFDSFCGMTLYDSTELGQEWRDEHRYQFYAVV
jgi:hypothetical protein